MNYNIFHIQKYFELKSMAIRKTTILSRYNTLDSFQIIHIGCGLKHNQNTICKVIFYYNIELTNINSLLSFLTNYCEESPDSSCPSIFQNGPLLVWWASRPHCHEGGRNCSQKAMDGSAAFSGSDWSY